MSFDEETDPHRRITLQSAGRPELASDPAINHIGPGEEEIVVATDNTAGGRLRAKFRKLAKSRQEIGVPGWLNPETGKFDLLVVCKPLSDRKEIARGMTNEQTIINSTAAILERLDDGKLQEIPGGWSGIAAQMGMPHGTTEGDVVRTVLGSYDEELDKVVENPLRVDALAQDIVNWMAGRAVAIEQTLGE